MKELAKEVSASPTSEPTLESTSEPTLESTSEPIVLLSTPEKRITKLGKEIVKHTTRLSNAAVSDVKTKSECHSNDEKIAEQKIAEQKDPRNLFIDSMKIIHLDDGQTSVLSSISARIETDIKDVFRKAGYKEVPADLLPALVSTLAERELNKYQKRLFVIRKHIALRLNEVLKRLWALNHGKASFPESCLIRAKRSKYELDEG